MLFCASYLHNVGSRNASIQPYETTNVLTHNYQHGKNRQMFPTILGWWTRRHTIITAYSCTTGEKIGTHMTSDLALDMSN